MRVHGEKTISRRNDVLYQTDYRNYEHDLREDFHHICGYCGKYEMISSKGMELDHFVPDHIDHSRQCDYTNLVYSCFTCNRKKSGKWPTLDKTIPHNGYVGFADPATPDFDLHLGREEDGEIEYYTAVGEYMYKTAFKFNLRQTRLIWRISQLYQLIEKMKLQIGKMSLMEKEECLSLFVELSELHKYMFDHKE